MQASGNDNYLQVVGKGLFETDPKVSLEKAKGSISISVQGLRAWNSNIYYVCLWNNKRLLIVKLPVLSEKLGLEDSLSDLPMNKYELCFEGCIDDAVLLFEETVFVLESNGCIYSVNTTFTNTSDSIDHMDVEDIFDCSPPSKKSKTWSKSSIRKIDCEMLIAACLVSNSVGVLVYKDKCLMVLMFENSDFKMKTVVNLEQFCSQIDQSKLEKCVLSCCSIDSLSPSMKDIFKGNLDRMAGYILVIGLPSGVVLWFSPESPDRGPFVLCRSYLQIQAIHWIQDEERISYLAIVMCSGRVILFGNRQEATLSLPDSVAASCSFNNGIVTSNRVHSYACHLKTDTQLTLDCVLIPLKGVCAFTSIPDSDLMLAATIHDSLYRFNPTVAPTQKSSQFVIPPQAVLNNMLTQTQNLEEIYSQMNLEDEILKAISSASVANTLPSLLTVEIQVLSDDEFSVVVKTLELRFSLELWTVCVEVVREGGVSDMSMRRLKQDLSEDSELVVKVQHKLCVDDVVRTELLCSVQQQAPLLTVVLPQVNINPLYLLSPTITSNKSTSQEALKELLSNLNIETANTKPLGCTVSMKIPDVFNICSFFHKVLHNCKHRIYELEWNKLEEGKKCSTKLYSHNESVVLNLDQNSRKLAIDCSSVQLCHQLKEFILKKIQKTNDKQFTEDLVLETQGLYQQFEIEMVRDQTDIERLDTFRNKLRLRISSNLST